MLPLSRMFAIAGLAFLLAAPAQAQSEPAPPDLSGTWVLNLSKSKLMKHSTLTAETVVITYTGQLIRFRDTISGKEDDRNFKTDGKEYPYATSRVGQNVVKATWKQSTLVIENVGRVRAPDGMGDMETLHLIDRWTLSADGRVLTDKSSGDFGAGQTFVYDKQ